MLRSTKHWFGVVLDASDAPALARFYAELLDWQVFNASDDWADVAPSESAGCNLACSTEADYARPVWPAEPGKQQMSMHLDFEVDDLETAVAHALRVGAELVALQPQPHVRVMLDPDGHPFCLYTDDDEE